ncbi:MAG: phosphatase [Actinomycetota bacterium]
MQGVDIAQVRAALIASGVTGPHRSHTRQNNISKIRALIEQDEEGWFGVTPRRSYAPEEILGFLAKLTGCSSLIEELAGSDTLDPDLTIKGIQAAGERLAAEARRGSTLLAVTGHPTGLLEHHIRVIDAYRSAGGKVIRLREEELIFSGKRGREYEVRYVGDVGCLADWGALRHTHSAEPMEALLEEKPWPDIVLGDHGFAGAAIERGIPTVAVMDINDPALAVAAAEDRDVVIIPMDDNRPPRSYEPSWRLIASIVSGQNGH